MNGYYSLNVIIKHWSLLADIGGFLMDLLITGATGFLCSPIFKALSASNFRVSIFREKRCSNFCVDAKQPVCHLYKLDNINRSLFNETD